MRDPECGKTMAKRDYFSEIEARRARLKKRTPRWEQTSARLDDLVEISNFIKNSTERQVPFKKELAKYISIGFIACVEGYFRIAVKDLVDCGLPFQANAAKLKDVKITLDHVVEIQKRRATLGEFISHAIAMSSLENINEALSTLMATDFLDALKNTPVDLSDEGPKSLLDMGIADEVIKDVNYSFEHRHLFAHEVAPKFKVDIKAIRTASQATLIFLHAAETLIESKIQALAPP